MRSDVSEKVKIENGRRKNREELAQGCILDAKTGGRFGSHIVVRRHNMRPPGDIWGAILRPL